MKLPDYLFNADYRQYNFVRDSAEYYEVTQGGNIRIHENRDWKLDGYSINNLGKLVKVSVR